MASDKQLRTYSSTGRYEAKENPSAFINIQIFRTDSNSSSCTSVIVERGRGGQISFPLLLSSLSSTVWPFPPPCFITVIAKIFLFFSSWFIYLSTSALISLWKYWLTMLSNVCWGENFWLMLLYMIAAVPLLL